MMDKINTCQDIPSLCEGFTDFLLKVSEGRETLSISLSGGSTPKALFDFWAGTAKDALPWDKFRFFWGDERCVPPEDEMSNYGMTYQHLIHKVSIPESNIFRIKGENEPEKEAIRYGELLAKELEMVNNTPRFDVMILGLGDDGHTASVFPHEIGLWENPANCVVARHPETGMKRISLTGKVINNASYVVFLVTGKNKAEKVRDIIGHRREFLSSYPAARVFPSSKNLYWFLDSQAAALLP